MAIVNTESPFSGTHHADSKPELLVSAVLYLMSHYRTGKTDVDSKARLAAVIERHLKMLAELPELAPVLQATCRQLSEQWTLMIAQAGVRKSLGWFARISRRGLT